MVTLHKPERPSITGAFCVNLVLFWSEEHAREDRSQAGGMGCTSMARDQAVYITLVLPGALFAQAGQQALTRNVTWRQPAERSHPA
jgi:hypothetical protein